MLRKEIIFLKRGLRFFLKRPVVYISETINKLGTRRKCNICNHTFAHFSKFRGGTKIQPEYLRMIQIIGSDIDNFGCVFCNSNDRERHLFLFFDKLKFWDKFYGKTVLHIAPESNLSIKIIKQSPLQYIKGDLFPDESKNIIKIDITNIQFKNNEFDFIICNHVLEHVPDIKKALAEIFRVLKPDGQAILQTPFSKLLSRNFEDKNINTEILRNFFYGQEDHVRVFGEKEFFDEIESAGFILKIQKHISFFDNKISQYFGINTNEDLILVQKPEIML